MPELWEGHIAGRIRDAVSSMRPGFRVCDFQPRANRSRYGFNFGRAEAMNDLRLADEVMNAAKYLSTQEETDVEVTLADGSRSLYIKGEEVAPVWMGAPMPLMEPGQSALQLDMTPTKIRLGRWRAEAGEFISVNSFSVPTFLDLYKASLSAAVRR